MTCSLVPQCVSTSLFGNTSSLVHSPSNHEYNSTLGTYTVFIAPCGTDMMIRNDATVTIYTKHQCITAMKFFENESLEELRAEYYLIKRIHGQQSATIYRSSLSCPMLDGMTQKCYNTDLQSLEGNNCSVPFLPGHAPTSDLRLVQVLEHSLEFERIKKNFLSSFPADYTTLVSIHEVHNVELWENFCRKKAAFLKKFREDRVSINERLAYHGTKPQLIEPIIHSGFDWRLTGVSSGTCYGKGSYFAMHACLSDRFVSKSDTGAECQMILSRVLLGCVAVGHSSYVRPPPRDPLKPYIDLYDSCVNCIVNPTIYVLFERDQAYPQYVITYKRLRTLPKKK